AGPRPPPAGTAADAAGTRPGPLAHAGSDPDAVTDPEWIVEWVAVAVAITVGVAHAEPGTVVPVAHPDAVDVTEPFAEPVRQRVPHAEPGTVVPAGRGQPVADPRSGDELGSGGSRSGAVVAGRRSSTDSCAGQQPGGRPGAVAEPLRRLSPTAGLVVGTGLSATSRHAGRPQTLDL
ncbi:MAG: hypothetical protein DLM59_16915, partial [Pseudonocardiales bacterium]